MRAAGIISIHALREEGDAGRGKFHPVFQISIHALREEGDVGTIGSIAGTIDFYPRPPRGGRLGVPTKIIGATGISIHALREEGDSAMLSRTL